MRMLDLADVRWELRRFGKLNVRSTQYGEHIRLGTPDLPRPQ
ncbi:hypothetical protein [Streptosporangium sp. KLBMP 9127]